MGCIDGVIGGIGVVESISVALGGINDVKGGTDVVFGDPGLSWCLSR